MLRSLVFTHLEEAFLSNLLIYTNASVDHAKNLATAAAIITAHQYQWKEDISVKTTSTAMKLRYSVSIATSADAPNH